MNDFLDAFVNGLILVAIFMAVSAIATPFIGAIVTVVAAKVIL